MEMTPRDDLRSLAEKVRERQEAVKAYSDERMSVWRLPCVIGLHTWTITSTNPWLRECDHCHRQQRGTVFGWGRIEP